MFVTAEPRRKDKTRRNPSAASANEFTPLRVRFFFSFFFFFLCAKRTENDAESAGLRAAVWHNVCGPSRSSGAHCLALLSLNKWRKSRIIGVKQVHGGGGDTYLYATIHNVESINRIADQNSIQRGRVQCPSVDYEVCCITFTACKSKCDCIPVRYSLLLLLGRCSRSSARVTPAFVPG